MFTTLHVIGCCHAVTHFSYCHYHTAAIFCYWSLPVHASRHCLSLYFTDWIENMPPVIADRTEELTMNWYNRILLFCTFPAFRRSHTPLSCHACHAMLSTRLPTTTWESRFSIDWDELNRIAGEKAGKRDSRVRCPTLTRDVSFSIFSESFLQVVGCRHHHHCWLTRCHQNE